MNKLNDAGGISNHEVIFRFIFLACSVGKFCEALVSGRMPDDQTGIIRIRDLSDSTFSTVGTSHKFESKEPIDAPLTTHALLRKLENKITQVR